MDANATEKKLNELLVKKEIEKIYIHRSNELVVIFKGGLRFFVDVKEGETLNFSITGEK
jgi:hypothetical protein